MDDGDYDDDEYDWDVPVGSCDNCGCDLFREDEEVCDQCAWWLHEAD